MCIDICSYCGTRGSVIDVSILRDAFSNLLKEYVPAEYATCGLDLQRPQVTLIDAIQRDWNVFSSTCRVEQRRQFLPSVFTNDSNNRSYDYPAVPFHRNAMSTAFDRWREFWFIDPEESAHWMVADLPEDIDVIGSFVYQKAQHLKNFSRLLPEGAKFWRARNEYVGTSEWDCRPLALERMGHNPRCPASRLNREGEVVLYSAEAEKTAVAEIRPGKGFICSTCELTTTKSLIILDLASSINELNPFTTSDLSWQLDLQRVARNVGANIAKPVSRGEDPAVYKKAQYLAMIARAMKLDGIRFSSSMDSPEGVNLALFDPSVVEFSNARLISITNTDISYQEIGSQSLAALNVGS